ncbi:ABC transporter permease [Pueribacillus theae]|uniref:ABC transporter permease n=1 Tax=Pueribacillus theae TaxID=2171751 RepID=A0A2U1K5W7_9BACI|nr:ABC transporter permease [Pueribacillus theae]PWA12308.1 ABC transporter permease [Pueribacillus theae]
MTLSFKRVFAIFQKDWKDLLKNSYIIFTMAIPLIFAAWLGRIGTEDGFLHSLPISLALVISGCFVQAAMVAEEKEKNTLRGLLLSPASTTEILIGKSLLTAAVTIVIIIGSIFLSEFNVQSISLFSLLILLNLVTFISIGTILGLVSRTVMETSIIGMPVMLIFGMGSMFKTMIENETLLKILHYLPSEQFNEAWLSMSEGGSFGSIGNNLLILLVWCIVALVISFITYRRSSFDK